MVHLFSKEPMVHLFSSLIKVRDGSSMFAPGN